VVKITGGEIMLRVNTFVETNFTLPPQTSSFSQVAVSGVVTSAK
jgi:hypothetical protein